MITSLLSYIKSRGLSDNINYILPKMIHFYQRDFCRFADCGAGVGCTSINYSNILKKNLSEDVVPVCQL